MKVKITEETTQHDTVDLMESTSLPQAAVLAEIAKALWDSNEHLQEFCKTHDMFKYVDEIGIEAIIVGWAGEPMGIVQYVDDEPAFLPFKATSTGPLPASRVNALAQRFYEASALSEIPMTAKPAVVNGIEAVLREVGVEFEAQ